MICSNCHKEINKNSNFCKYCGTKTINFSDNVQTNKKDGKTKTILLLFFIFVAVSETVFLGLSFYDLKNINKTSNCPASDKEECSNEDVGNSINVFGSKFNLNENYNYEFFQGKLILNKKNSWQLLAVGLVYDYSVYSSQIDNIKTRLFVNNYVVNKQETKELLEKERVIFYLTRNDEKSILVYTPSKNKKTIMFELYNNNETNEKDIIEALEIFDNAKDLDVVLESKNSLIVNESVNIY